MTSTTPPRTRRDLRDVQAAVPYITAWSREVELAPKLLVLPGDGFTFEGAVRGDRDAGGALYRRQAIISSGDRGVPDLGKVHSRRQRRCMTRLLCQVCAGPPSVTSEGVLFLDQNRRSDWKGWPETLGTVHPPLCLPCAEVSVQRCPHLRRSSTAIRVRDPQPWGVFGMQYTLDPDNSLQPDKPVELEYGDPRLGWTIASQMIMRLIGCTIVDLEAELDRHRALPAGADGEGSR
ncbi:hypothetical protein ABH940_005400 [Streptacidiphilus sp. BW17]|uniref:hypothetical protein n=1 Tax=Streptacidiphilus sp. BW17 TaxID=3156274 RepID=UPI003515D861